MVGMKMTSLCSASGEDIDVPKDLECLICGDLLENAVSLQACAHTFCSVCFRIHYREAKEKRCPLCKVSVGNDLRKALLVNGAVQKRVREFKSKHSILQPSLPFHDKLPNAQEAPIREQMQRRNYSMLLKHGKKGLQKVCKEYSLPTSGNEQELVDRLRYFQCMWDAELDTIYTPLRPSELVAKFKKKERLQREEKSRAMMTGSINDSKHMKNLTSSLLNDNTRKDQKVRNERKVSATSSGNAQFDIKFRSNFEALIAQGRKHMKKGPGCPRRVYDDDNIHDNPAPTTNSLGSDNEKISPNIDGSCAQIVANINVRISNRTHNNGVTSVGSSVEHGSSLNRKKRPLVSPCTLERKKNTLCYTAKESLGASESNIFNGHSSKIASNQTTSSGQLRPSKSQKGTVINNPYRKKRRRSPSKAKADIQDKGGNSSCAILPFQKRKFQTCNTLGDGGKGSDSTVLAQENITNGNTIGSNNRIHQNKTDSTLSIGKGSQDDSSIKTETIPTRKKYVIRNPYLKSSGKKDR